jgi:hypothetical protein
MSDDTPVIKRTYVDLPDGMTWDMAEEASRIIEDWEEEGAANVFLAIKLFRLFVKEQIE